MAPQIPPVTLLFVPGHRQRMVERARELDVDAVVFDLEDSVPPAEKAAARSAVQEALASWPGGAARAYVRVNPPRERAIEEDARVLVEAEMCGVLVPKVDRSLEIEMLAGVQGIARRDVIVTVETARGLLHAEEIADHPLVDGLCLGGEDLAFALGMRRTPGGEEFAIARFLLVAAARAAGIAVYDAICPEFRDLEVLAADAARGAAVGMDGKFAIHPAQIPVIREAFRPPREDLDSAAEIVAAYDAAVGRGEGAVAVDGRMIDPPVAERYRAMLQRWG